MGQILALELTSNRPTKIKKKFQKIRIVVLI